MITNIYSYLETSGGQSSNPYLNVVHFFPELIRHLRQLKTAVSLHWCLICAVPLWVWQSQNSVNSEPTVVITNIVIGSVILNPFLILPNTSLMQVSHWTWFWDAVIILDDTKISIKSFSMTKCHESIFYILNTCFSNNYNHTTFLNL